MTVAEKTNEHGHDNHELHKPTLFPPFLAISSILLAFAVAFIANDVSWAKGLLGLDLEIDGVILTVIGFALAGIYLVFLLIFFFKEALNKEVKPKLYVDVVSKNLWMWLFLASEIIFFGVLIGTMLILRFITQAKGFVWMDNHTFEILTSDLSLYPTIFITFILLMSSVTMMKAVEAMERSNRIALRNWLLATVVGGIIFLVVKLFEYNNLMTVDHIFVDTNQFWTTFYLTTGFHTLHVLVGVIILVAFLIKATFVKGETGFNAENGTPVEIIGMYWHFVDIVWIFLMPIIYLIT